jgi:MFS family permease
VNPVTRPLLALAATLAVQMLGSMVLTIPSVIAPAVAPSLGLSADRVGLFVGIAYFAAMLSGLASGGWVARLGAVTVSQGAMAACALGAFIAIAGGTLPLALAAVLIGTGYGMINPSSTSLLGQHAPLSNRGLFFSLKQTGVPLGVALSGVAMPWGLQTLGWQVSTALAGAAGVLLALLLWPAIARLEPRHASRPGVRHAAAPTAAPAQARSAPAADGTTPTRAAVAEPGSASGPGLRAVLRNRPVLRLSMMSFTFGFTQLCFVTFLVSYLNLSLGRSLALAAAILAGVQVISTIARIVWGVVGDRWIDPSVLLGGLGLAMGAAGVGLALLPASAGDVTIVLAATACAATAMGWNGVYFAELARLSKPEEVAAMAGASQFFTFCGSMSGPVVFAEIVRHGGSYAGAYATLALLPVAAGVMMLRQSGRARLSKSRGAAAPRA